MLIIKPRTRQGLKTKNVCHQVYHSGWSPVWLLTSSISGIRNQGLPSPEKRKWCLILAAVQSNGVDSTEMWGRNECLLVAIYLASSLIKTIDNTGFNLSILNKALRISTNELKWNKYVLQHRYQIFSPLFSENRFLYLRTDIKNLI